MTWFGWAVAWGLLLVPPCNATVQETDAPLHATDRRNLAQGGR